MAARIDIDELSLRKVLLISGAIYIAGLPLFAYGQWSYVPSPLPKGAVIEQIKGFKETPDGRYITRTFRFVREKHIEGGRVFYKDFTKPKPLVVYEDDIELPAANYEIQTLTPSDTWRYVTILPSDGSDPRYNGRKYYVVLP